MSNAASQLQAQLPQLTVAQRRIANPNDFQFYVLYGTEPGPWAKIGLNDTEYLIGFLPQQPKARRRPSPKNVVPLREAHEKANQN